MVGLSLVADVPCTPSQAVTFFYISWERSRNICQVLAPMQS